jgi:hypothetical protein
MNCPHCGSANTSTTDGRCVCHACGRSWIQGEFGRMKHAIAIAVLALTIQAPAGCTITGTTVPDEGFPVATCQDGSVWYQDMDGQPYENAAGRPVYPAGTWVEMPS